MDSQRDDSSERERRVADVLADYFAAVESGRAPDRQALLAQHPELAAELAEYFEQQERFDRLVEPLRPVAAAAEATGHADATASLAPEGHEAGPRELGGTTHAGLGTTAPDAGTPPPPGGTPSTDGGGDDPPRGARVRYFGDYELLGVLGRGGMGVVYRARQRSLNRLVAVKMIKAGAWAGAEEVRRFRNEAEAVANLDHPGIVPIHEVGEHRRRHYFSMKLVEGPSLAERLADYAADPRKAAEVVATIARAVHHAHQRGILHRDLKPSNILLDAQGRPHVTDFGLARRIETNGELSQSGSVVGTPSYMSPEQAEGHRGSITTATDVYGLGAILYAVLTGRPPFQADSVLDILQQVREHAPDAPSCRNPGIDRDLEVICLKCLEKDPRRRYDSAAAVADDLERYLRVEPILARPISPLTRVAMWGRRKPGLAALSGALVVALFAGFAGVTWQWRETVHQRNLLAIEQQKTVKERDLKEAQRKAAVAAEQAARVEKTKAEAINKFLIDDLLYQADPGNNPVGNKVTLLQVLDRAAARVERAFPGQPEVEATVRYTIGETYRGLNEFAKAESYYRKAFELRRGALGAEHPDTLKVVNQLGDTLWLLEGRFDEGVALMRQNLETCRRVLGAEHPVSLEAVSMLAFLLQGSQPAEAEALYRRDLDAIRRVWGDHGITLGALRGFGLLLQGQDKLSEAEAIHRERWEIALRTYGRDHPITQSPMFDLLGVLPAQGKRIEAESLARQVLEIRRRVYGPNDSEMRAALEALARFLKDQGRLDEAEPLFREEVETLRRSPPDIHSWESDWKLAATLRDLSEVLSRLGKLREARSTLLEAESQWRKAVATRRTLPGDEWRLPFMLRSFGGVLTELGKASEAEPLFREALAIWRRRYPPDHPRSGLVTAIAEVSLGRCLTALKRYGEAESLLLSAYQALQPHAAREPGPRREALDGIVMLYEAWGKPEQALVWRLKRMDADFPDGAFAR
jgi:serine/threonine-protein kinase